MNTEQILKALECHLSTGIDCYQTTCPLIDDEKCRLTLKNVVMTFVKELLAENAGLKTALETLKGEIDRVKLEASEIMTGARKFVDGLLTQNENLIKENKYLRERLAEEAEIKAECFFSVDFDIKAIKTDTVKKMQERLHEEAWTIGEGWVVDLESIDQIAKEILEGTQND